MMGMKVGHSEMWGWKTDIATRYYYMCLGSTCDLEKDLNSRITRNPRNYAVPRIAQQRLES